MATEIASGSVNALANYLSDLQEVEKKAQPTRVTFTTTMQCDDGEPEPSYIQNLKFQVYRSLTKYLAQRWNSYDSQLLFADNVDNPYNNMYEEGGLGHHYASKTKTLRIFWNMWTTRDLLPHLKTIVQDASWMTFEHENSQFPTTVQYTSHRRTHQAVLYGIPTLYPELYNKYVPHIMEELAKKGIISKEAELLTISPRGFTSNEGASPEIPNATQLTVEYVDSQPGKSATLPIPGDPNLTPWFWKPLRPRRTHVPLDTVPSLTHYPVREVQYATMLETNEIQNDDLTDLEQAAKTTQQKQEEQNTGTQNKQPTTQKKTDNQNKDNQEMITTTEPSNTTPTEPEQEPINRTDKKQKPATTRKRQQDILSKEPQPTAEGEGSMPLAEGGPVQQTAVPPTQELQEEAQNNSQQPPFTTDAKSRGSPRRRLEAPLDDPPGATQMDQ